MLDDLRNSADFKEEPQAVPGKKRKKSKKFLGMTAPQRFIFVLMLLILVVVLGSMCLMITGKVVL